MNRRRFLTNLSVVGTGSLLATKSVSAKEPEDLWIQDPETPDFESIAYMVNQFIQNKDIEETEDESVRTVSDTVREVGQPLEDKFGEYGNEAKELEENINDVFDYSSQDVDFVLSIIESLEEMYGVSILPIAKTHISIASRRAFLLKSLFAATINFYEACGQIESYPDSKELSEKLKWNFYVSLLILIAEIVLAKYPFDYKIAWKGTRFIHNQFLVRMRSIIGPKAIGLIMTGVHWLGIRSRVTVSFGADLAKTIENLYNNRQDIYQDALGMVNSLEDTFTMKRLEDYNRKTILNVGSNSAVDFLVDAVLKPLSEVLDEFSALSPEDFTAIRNGNLGNLNV